MHYIALYSIVLFCSSSQEDSILIKYGRFSRYAVTWDLDCDVSTVYWESSSTDYTLQTDYPLSTMSSVIGVKLLPQAFVFVQWCCCVSSSRPMNIGTSIQCKWCGQPRRRALKCKRPGPFHRYKLCRIHKECNLRKESSTGYMEYRELLNFPWLDQQRPSVVPFIYLFIYLLQFNFN